MKIPLSDVVLSGNEISYCMDALKTGWISSRGYYIKHLEKLLAEKVGRKYVICVSNGTMALELALRGLNISAGDEVIVPALTFAAPASSVAALGAIPIFADITKATWTIDPQEVRKLITKRTKAIIAVDILGHPCDYDHLKDLGIPVIEDAAEAHGALYKGKSVGSFGAVSIFSFHGNKTVTTGEGGCVATDDEALAKKMRLITNHGMDPNNPYWHVELGRNFRMTNLTAAIGCAQMEKWDELVAARNCVAKKYDEDLIQLPLKRRPVAPWAKEGCWLYTVTSPFRTEILQSLRQNRIDARAIWFPLPDNPIFKNARNTCYPITNKIASEAFLLPTWAYMPVEKINYVVNNLKKAVSVFD